jgi:hypothetical protein
MLKLSYTLFLLSAVGLAQEQPAVSQNQNPTQEPAGLEGKVTSLTGGQPLKKVNLTLYPIGNGSGDSIKPYGTVSDTDGKFVFESVEPGRYTLAAERTGYVRQNYGAKHSQARGTTLSLSSGQHLKDINFQLTPQSALSGKVLDDDGDPLGRTQVQVMQMGYQKGKRGPVGRRSSMSDENGEFKIANLAPGRYYLCASTPMRMSALQGTRSASADPTKANVPREDFAPTCYPNAADEASAVPVDVMPGRDVPGLDIRLRKSAVVRVKGQLAGDIPGRPYEQIQVSLQPAEFGRGMMMSFGGGGNADKKGNFELASVHPGSYRLTAMSFQGTPMVLGTQLIEVGNEDLKDVLLRLTPPADLKGRLIIEGQKSASAQQNEAKDAASGQSVKPTPTMQVQFFPTDTVSFGSGNSSVADDGTFALSNVTPAKYQLSLSPLPDGAYLRSVRVGEQEMPPHAIDLSSGVAGELQVFVKMSAGEVDGAVHDDNNQPAAGAIVTLVPDPPNPEQEQLYHTASADQNGSFQVKNVAPGTYRVYAWEDLDSGAQMDPDFLKPHSGQSERVTIDDNGHAQVNLTRIAAAAVDEAKAKGR